MQDFLDETERKGLTVIYVMTNGVTLQVPQKVVFRKHELQSWDPIIRFLDKKLDIPEGVERIATIFGDILLEPRELQHGFVYVALQPLKPFVELDYLELFKYLCSNYRGNYILSIEPAPIQTSEVVRRRTMSTVEPLTSFAGTTSRLSEFDIEQRKSRTSERKMSMPFSRSREPSTTSKRSFNPNSTAGASRTAASNRKTSTVSVEPRKSNISHIDDDNVDQQRKSVMSYRRKSSAKGAMDQNKIIPTRPSIMSEKRKSRTSVAPRVSYVNNVEGYNDTVQQQESFLSNKTVPDDDEVEEELAQLIPTESTAEQTISKTRASQTYKQSKSPEMINEDSELITESRINNRFNGKSVQSVIDPEFKEKKSVTKPPTSCPNFRECDCPEIESDISVTNIQKRMSKSTTVNVPGSKRATRPTIMNQLPEVESVVSARGNEEFEDDSPTYCPVYKDCNCAEISNEIARRNTNRPTAIDISALDCKCQDEATQNDLENSMDELPVKQSAPKIPSIPEKKRTSTIADNKRGEKRKSRTQDQENRQSRKSLSRKSLNNENEFNGNAVLTRDTGQSRRSIPGQIIQSIPFQIQDSRSYIANCECDNVSGQTTERCNRNKLPADRSEFFEGGGYTAEQRYSTIKFKSQSQMSQAQRRSVSKRSINPLDTEDSEYEGNIIQTGNVGRSTVKTAPSSSRRSLGKDEFDGDEAFRSRHQTQMSQAQRRSVSKRSISPLDTEESEYEGNIIQTGNVGRSTVKTAPSSSRRSLGKDEFDGDEAFRSRHQTQMSQAQRRSVSKRSISPLDTEESEYEGNIIQTGNVGRSTVKTAPSSSRRSLGKDEFDGDETFRSRHQTQMSQAQRRSVSKRSISPLDTEESEYEGNIIQTGNVGRSTVKAGPSSSRRSLGKDEFDGDEAFRSRHQTQMSQAQRRSVSKRSISPLDTEDSEYEGNIIQTGNVGRSTVKTAPSSSRRSLGKDEFDGDETFRSRHQTQMSQAQRRSVSKRSISPLDTEDSEYEGNIIQTGNVGRSTVKTAPSSSRRSLGKDEFDGDETFRSRHQTQMSQAQRRSVSKRSISPLDTEESEYEGNIIQTGNVGRSTVKAAPSSSRRSLGKDEFDGDETFRSRHQTQIPDGQRHSTFKHSIIPLPIDDYGNEGNIVPTDVARYSTTSSRKSLTKRQSQISQAQRRSTLKQSVISLPTEEYEPERSDGTRCGTLNTEARNISKYPVASGFLKETESTKDVPDRRQSSRQSRISQMSSTFKVPAVENCECEESIEPTGDTGYNTFKPDTPCTFSVSVHPVNSELNKSGDCTIKVRRQSQIAQAKRRSTFKSPVSILPSENRGFNKNIDPSRPDNSLIGGSKQSVNPRCITIKFKSQSQMSQTQRRSVAKRSINPLDTEDSEYEGNIIQTGNVGRSTVKAAPSSSRRSLGKDEFDGDETFRSRHQTQMSQAQRRSVSKRSINPMDTEESEYVGNIIQTGNVGRSTVKAAPSSSRRSLGKDEFDGDEAFRSRHQTQMSQAQRRSVSKRSINPMDTEESEYVGNIIQTGNVGRSTVKAAPSSSRRSLGKDEFDGDEAFRSRHQTQMSQAQRRSVSKRSINPMDTEESEYVGNIIPTGNVGRSTVKAAPSSSRRSLGKDEYYGDDVQRSQTFKSGHPLPIDDFEPAEKILPIVRSRRNNFKSETSISRKSFTTSPSAENANEDTARGRSTIKARLESKISQAQRNTTFKAPVSLLPDPNCDCEEVILPTTPNRRTTTKQVKRISKFPGTDRPPEEWGPARSRYDTIKSELKRSVDTNCECEDIDQKPRNANSTFPSTDPYPDNLELGEYTEKTDFVGEDQTYCTQTKKVIVDKSASCPLVSVTILCKEECRSKSSEVGTSQTDTSYINENEPTKKDDSLCCCMTNENQSENTGIVAKYVNETCGTANQNCRNPNSQQSPGTHNDSEPYEDFKCNKNVKFCQLQNQNALPCGQNSVCPKNVRDRNQMLSYPCSECQDEQEPPALEGVCGRGRICDTNKDIVLKLQILCNKHEEESKVVSCSCKDQEAELEPEPEELPEFEDEPEPEPDEYPEPEEELEAEPEERYEEEPEDDLDLEEQPEQEPEEQYEWEPDGMEPEPEEPTLDQEYEEDLNIEPNEKERRKTQRISNKGPMPMMTTSRAFMKTETRLSCTRCRRFCCGCSVQYFKYGS
ncbi:uncharacterized protein LOC130894184 isoform X2 [Diorhabda carinulata]|nr:uncharacterized protein LOC130894184 isoform X2 [Diorhabda carinulata]XP_057656794.1 uncharacterized protein LOC130894184 isoform X2 [Diorhabda carinulata]XP_057656795.1 uncharacterized protein LOC130894184 isoform X2 [Diorhabda carinulata]